MRHHYDALEADFSRYYDLDLTDLWTGDLRMVRAANLATWLPFGAAVYRAEGSDRAWTDGERLQNAAVYHLSVISWQLGGGEGSQPRPLASPSEQAEQHAALERDMDKAQRFIERQKAREERRRERLSAADGLVGTSGHDQRDDPPDDRPTK